jgi:hypothetical protein
LVVLAQPAVTQAHCPTLVGEEVMGTPLPRSLLNVASARSCHEEI